MVIKDLQEVLSIIMPHIINLEDAHVMSYHTDYIMFPSPDIPYSEQELKVLNELGVSHYDERGGIWIAM